MGEPILGLQSSLGFVYPDGAGAFMRNPGYSSSDPPSMGSITAGSHTYNVEGRYMYGDPVPYITEGSTLVAWPYFKYGNRQYVGFMVTTSGDTATIWFVDSDYEMTSQTALVAQNGQNMPYAATNFATCPVSDFVEFRQWDEAPSTDPADDPFNNLPSGGEYADTDGFWESDIVDINAFNNIDQDTSLIFDYSSFIKHYVLSEANMADIGNNFFLPDFWTALNNKFQGLSDPMSFIISAVELPFGYSDTPTTFHLGGVTLLNPNDTGIACYETKKRYINFSAGSRTIKEVWGSARDYSDIQVQLFLPYCGVKELDPDLIVNHTITLACNVDMLTGDLVWLVQTSNAGLSGTYFQQQTIPYRFTGNCGKQVPLGRFDNSNAILGMMGMLAGSVIGGVGAAAGAVGPAVAVGEGTAAMGAGASVSGAASAATGATSFLANGMNARANTSSGVSGSFGSMDVKYPYLVVKRSVPKYPNGWRAEFGAPRYQKFSGTDLHGFTLFSDFHVDLPQGASDSERSELERVLKTEGVIL